MLRPIATLETPTTCVKVSDGGYAEPTEIITKLDQPTMCLLVVGSGNVGEAAFLGRPTRRLCRVGRVIFTPPGREVLGRGAPGKMRVVACSFDRSYCERIVGSLDALSEKQLLSCLNVQSALLPAMFSRLMAEALHPGLVSTALVDSLGQAMLVEWSHAVLSKEAAYGHGRLLPRHFRIIDECLAASSGKAPRVSDIAAACGFSERYFAKLFREQTNQSIRDYLKSVQISKAQSFLLQTDLPLKEIAYRLGFSTPANFSDAFHAATGETPGRFRAANRAHPTRRMAS